MKDAIKNTLARSDQFVKTLGEGRDDLFNTLNNPMSIANQIEDLTNVFTSDAAKNVWVLHKKVKVEMGDLVVIHLGRTLVI